MKRCTIPKGFWFLDLMLVPEINEMPIEPAVVKILISWISGIIFFKAISLLKRIFPLYLSSFISSIFYSLILEIYYFYKALFLFFYLFFFVFFIFSFYIWDFLKKHPWESINVLFLLKWNGTRRKLIIAWLS